MRALVTGGAGFIGSHIAERLLKEGNSVVILDNFSSGKESNLEFASDYSLTANRYKLIKGDIRNYQDCLSACKDVEVIFHEAALRSVAKSLEEPAEYNEVNINGTLNVLKAARECGVKRFVLASSSSIYGDTNSFPEKETDYPLLISPYALTKLTGEHYCNIFSKNFGVETVSLRYFNVYGPRQALDDEYAVVIPKFITCMLKDQQPPIHGDGLQSRDFAYIGNVVSANLLAAKATGVAGSVFNIAGGKDYTILDLVNILNSILSKSIKPAFTPTRPGDVLKSLADMSEAKSKLGYEPLIGFEEGLRRTVDYFAKQSSAK